MGIEGAEQSISFYIGDLHFVNWRLFLIICTLPALISAISLLLMPETPAYLLHVSHTNNIVFTVMLEVQPFFLGLQLHCMFTYIEYKCILFTLSICCLPVLNTLTG